VKISESISDVFLKSGFDIMERGAKIKVFNYANWE
jgi:hypothetical protein